MNQLDTTFREEIQKHPKEAMSHFEIVDPGVWRLDEKGHLSNLGGEWAGPYSFAANGNDYEAFGLKRNITESQKRFLSDLGVEIPSESMSPLAFVLGGGVLVAAAVLVFAFLPAKRQESSREPATRSGEFHVARHEERMPTLPALPPSSGTKLMSLYERAKRGDGQAMFEIGSAYHKGEGVPMDFATAKTWFGISRDVGHSGGPYGLAEMYLQGSGFPVDYHKAAELLNESKSRGGIHSGYLLGTLYEEGKLGRGREGEAAECYAWAGPRSHAAACMRLGGLYERGAGVPKDEVKASEWYRKGGDLGNAHAAFLLARLLEDGHGVLQNKSEAKVWYRKAADLGHAQARVEYNRLKGE